MNSWVITSRHIFKLRHDLACRETLHHFSFCRRVQNIGNRPFSFKNLTFKNTVIRQSRGMRTLNSGRQPYIRPLRNNENRLNSRVGIITLNWVSYKVRTAVPLDCQTVRLCINGALVRVKFVCSCISLTTLHIQKCLIEKLLTYFV